MNWAMPSGIGSKIATATVMGALAAIPALSAPAHAFAAQTPSHAPADSAISPANISYQTTNTNIPTSSDSPRHAQLSAPTSYHGDPDDDDDVGDYFYY